MDMSGFKKFLMRGNVIDLAVAVVLGAAFGTVVASLVRDLLTPLISAIGGLPDFSRLSFTINGAQFNYGNFINALLSFLIIAATVYYLVIIPLNKVLKTRLAEGTTKKCPECLSEVPIQATRCAFCTTQLEPVRIIRTGGGT